MRSLALLVLLGCSTALASPYDYGWGGVAIGMGPPQSVHGELRTRAERSHCGDGTCQLGGRVALGGGWGRWSGELAIAVIPVDDTTPMMGGARHAVMYGPQVRYSVARRWGFDLSARLGSGFGSFDRDAPRTETRCTGVDPPTCSSHEIDDGYSAASLSGGITLMWRARFDGGFFALHADLDTTLLSIAYPEGGVSGLVTGKTFGFAFGTTFSTN